MASASSRTSRRPIGPRGSRSRSSGSRTTACPNYELPSNIPGLVLQRPAGEGPGAVRRPWRDERRRGCPDAHRVHRGPEERRGRQERRHQHGDAGRLGSTRSSGPTATPTRRPGSATTSTSRRSSTGPDDIPVIINQAYRYNNTLGEVCPRLPPEGRRRLRARLPRRAVPLRRDERARGPGDQGARRPVRRRPRRPTTTRSSARPPSRSTPSRPSPRRPTRPTCRPTPRSSSSTSTGSPRTSTCPAR